MAIQDVIFELNRVKADGLIADYAIGGAIAAQAYIETSSTEDVDVFVVASPADANSLAPLGTVWPDLVAHGAKQLDGGYLEIGGWPVQLLPTNQPLYDDAIANAQTKDFGGNQVGRIMRPEHLAAIALATGRVKDYGRVDEFIRSGKIDVADLEALINRFGLTERWKTFRSKFLGDQ